MIKGFKEFIAQGNALELAVAVVDDLDAALEHVDRYGTGHSESIVSQDRAATRRWVAEVDAAATTD